MKWSRAVHHLESLAESCAEMTERPASIFPLRVSQLWAVGDLLEQPRDLEWITVALGVDLHPEQVPWWSQPKGGEHWANATRMAKNPVLAWWRSTQAPVWNHRIVRPALVWDEEKGVREETLAALAEGQGDRVRTAAPDPVEYGTRLEAELAISLASLRGCTQEYEERRWAPGKLTPVSDALWRASDGYLDVFTAIRTG